MTDAYSLHELPEGIPPPVDDGACDHLPRDGRIEKVFYPVFPPGENASEVVEWLSGMAA
jgi:hypothetical protein